MRAYLNAWLLLACLSILGIAEAVTRRVHVPIRVDVVVTAGKARTLKGRKRPLRKKAPVKKAKKRPTQKRPKVKPTRPLKKPPVKKPPVKKPTGTTKISVNEQIALKAQLAVATRRINLLTAQYRLASLKAGQAENLAAELLEASRRLDEANLALESGQSSTRLTEAFRNLNKQINVLNFELAKQRQEAEFHKSKSKSQEHDIALYNAALASYILGDEKFLHAYDAYQSLFSTVLEHTPEAVQAARKELLDSWQAYEEAVHTFNKVLRQIGMLTHTVKVNPIYRQLLEGALQESELPTTP